MNDERSKMSLKAASISGRTSSCIASKSTNGTFMWLSSSIMVRWNLNVLLHFYHQSFRHLASKLWLCWACLNLYFAWQYSLWSDTFTEIPALRKPFAFFALIRFLDQMKEWRWTNRLKQLNIRYDTMP